MFRKYKNLRRFKKYYIKYKSTIIKLITVMILASSLGMLLPYQESKRLIGISEMSIKQTIEACLIIMIIIVFHHTFWYLWEKIGSLLTNKIANDVRSDIVLKFINTKYSEIKNNTSGYYLERLNDDTLEVSGFLSYFLGVSADCLSNFSFLVFIYILNYQCGIIFTIGIIIIYIIELIKTKKELKYTEILKKLSEEFNSKINENYRGIKDIKCLGIKKQIILDTSEISKEIAKIQIKKDKMIAFLSRCKTFTQHLLTAFLFIYSVCILMPQDMIPVISFLTIVNYSGFMYDLVEYIAKIKNLLEKGDYKASRILEILDTPNIEQYGSIDKLNHYSIEIKNLTYSYDDNIQILKNINLYINPNSLNLFIGSSGSGKTTLFSLLSKLFQVSDNKVFIGNTDINKLSERCIRNNLCVINQEPFLLNDTILNNIKVVKTDAKIEEIYNACKKANIYQEILNFEKGFDTIIFENGSNLSGGQKQRIAIARAILKDVPILLFDEPTSALDKKNQELFFNTISLLKSQKTILVIAHKLNEYKNFDNVYELKEGKLLRKEM